ncbi:MAG: amidohydrolase family protein, partial [Tissierellia bacterium]|nr:amidohydrolase family protein [Tissierellia bacterium]
IDIIGSDHGPFLKEEKEVGINNIFKSPAGFPGIDFRVPLILNCVKEKRLTLKRAVELLSTNPAKIFNIYPQKGIIRLGSDADLILVDFNKAFKIDKKNSYSKSKESALIYDGRNLEISIEYTISRGEIIMEKGKVSEQFKGRGKYIYPTQ